MRNSLLLSCLVISVFLVVYSCAKEEIANDKNLMEIVPSESSVGDTIVLGRKLNNPYALLNMRAALAELLQTKSVQSISPEDLEANWLYVRFLPKDSTAVSKLLSLDLELFEYPIDYEILEEGNFYHDPSVEASEITWQYTRVRPDFVFPDGLQYEILEECYIPEDDCYTKSGDEQFFLDWETVAIRLAGLTEDDYCMTKASSKIRPYGVVSVYNDHTKTYEPVKGVKVRFNYFLKFSSTQTSASGVFLSATTFNNRPHLHIIYENERDFKVFNGAAMAAVNNNIGRVDNNRQDIKIDVSDNQWRFAVINNAAYDYYLMCREEGIKTPPENMRIWCLKSTDASSAPMLKHCGFSVAMKVKFYSSLTGITALNLSSFICLYGIATIPDIIIGVKGRESNDYASTYGTVWHELTHASHFSNVGKKVWGKYIDYVVTSQISTGDCYGDGTSTKEGRDICELGESWAYANERILQKDVFGDGTLYGYSNWFSPTISAIQAIKTNTKIRHKDYYNLLTDENINVSNYLGKLLEKHQSDSTVIKTALATIGKIDGRAQWMLLNKRKTGLYVNIERGFMPIQYLLKENECLCIAGIPSSLGTSFSLFEMSSNLRPNNIGIWEYDFNKGKMGSMVYYGSIRGKFYKSKRAFIKESEWGKEEVNGNVIYTLIITDDD